MTSNKRNTHRDKLFRSHLFIYYNL